MESAITNAWTGMSFGQLWQGDAVSAKKELDHSFGRGRPKLGAVEENAENRDNEKEEK